MLKRASRSRELLTAVVALVALISTAGVILIVEHTTTNLGEALAGVAAVNAVLGALAAVLQNRVMRREDVADQYALRASDPGMIEYNARISAFLQLALPLEAVDVSAWAKRSAEDRKSLTEAWNAKPESARREHKLAYWQSASQMERGELVVFANLLEEIALMHRLRRLDSEIVARHFAAQMRVYYTFARWFIAAVRHTPDGYNRRAYTEWESLAQRLAGGIHLHSKDREPLGVATDSGKLLDAIVAALDRPATLYLEGVSDSELQSFLKSHHRENGPKVCKGDLGSSLGLDFRVPLDGGATDELRERTSKLSADDQRPFRHLLVYRRRRVLLEAYDAGHGWVYASRKRLSKRERVELTERL